MEKNRQDTEFTFTQALEQAARAVKNSGNIVFFGGAGVSTASGIPDFRSPNGLYRMMKDAKYSPEYYMSHDYWLDSPADFTDFMRRMERMAQVAPNGAHKALAELEKKGKLQAVITQNIDSLHQKAGSRNVLELHGNTRDIYCPQCGEKGDYKAYMQGKGVFPCPRCGSPMRPDVTLYGEMLNEQTMDQALRAIREAEVLIVGGTSLVVYPAAGLIRYFHGHTLILINRDATSADKQADFVLHGDISEILPMLVPKEM